MIASPSARAVASTAAATIAGRAARSVTASIARSGLTPSAIAPSRQELGTDTSASQISAIMIGVIITVRITTVTASPAPVSSTTFCTEFFSARGDQVVADERHEHEDPDQPVDHRRHRGQQADHRDRDPAQPRRARARR